MNHKCNLRKKLKPAKIMCQNESIQTHIYAKDEVY